MTDDGSDVALTSGGSDCVEVSNQGGAPASTCGAAIVNDVAWSGTTLFAATDSGLAYGSGTTLAAVPAAGPFDYLNVAAGGGTVAGTSQTAVFYSTAGSAGPFTPVSTPDDQLINGVAVSLDGSQIALAVSGSGNSSTTEGIEIIDTTNGLPSQLLTQDSCQSVAWAAGPILFAACSGNIQIIDFTGLDTFTSIPGAYVTSISSSADGQTIYAAAQLGFSGALYVSTDGGATWTQQDAPAGGWTEVATSAAGDVSYAIDAAGIAYEAAPTGIITAHPSSSIELTADGTGDWFVSSVDGRVDAP